MSSQDSDSHGDAADRLVILNWHIDRTDGGDRTQKTKMRFGSTASMKQMQLSASDVLGTLVEPCVSSNSLALCGAGDSDSESAVQVPSARKSAGESPHM